jgi:hypothetical protein
VGGPGGGGGGFGGGPPGHPPPPPPPPPLRTQVWSSKLAQSVRLHACAGCAFVETEFQVGPIDGDVEFFTRYETDIDSGGVLYTDDSGLQTLRRVPPAAPFNLGSNFYPMVYGSYILGADDVQLSVLSAQSHGVTSRGAGELEFILHRRMLQFNPLNGLFEALNDTSVARGVQWLTVDNAAPATDARHLLAASLNAPPVLLFGVPGAGASEPAEFTPLLRELPANVQLLTLSATGGAAGGDVMLRLFHAFEVRVWFRGVVDAATTGAPPPSPPHLCLARRWVRALCTRSRWRSTSRRCSSRPTSTSAACRP